MKKTAKVRRLTILVIMILALALTGCGKAKAPASDTVQWFNNTYAVLTVLNERDCRVYGGGSPNIAEKALARALLENSWDVTDRASAEESLQWLLDEGHRIPLAEELAYLSEMGLADISEEERAEAVLSNFDLDEQQAGQYAAWFSLYEQYGEMMDSYLRGYEYWAEESSDERRDVYEDLKSSSDNPFALDWNTTLEKTW